MQKYAKNQEITIPAHSVKNITKLLQSSALLRKTDVNAFVSFVIFLPFTAPPTSRNFGAYTAF